VLHLLGLTVPDFIPDECHRIPQAVHTARRTKGDRSMTRLFLAVLLFALVGVVACDGTGSTTGGQEEYELAEACEECLDSGGTWQPEAEQCTADCDIMDISCYSDECPGACGDDCAYCFGSADCEDAGCTWRVEGEAMWCTG
jgi:hypothetical protein